MSESERKNFLKLSSRGNQHFRPGANPAFGPDSGARKLIQKALSFEEMREERFWLEFPDIEHNLRRLSLIEGAVAVLDCLEPDLYCRLLSEFDANDATILTGADTSLLQADRRVRTAALTHHFFGVLRRIPKFQPEELEAATQMLVTVETRAIAQYLRDQYLNATGSWKDFVSRPKLNWLNP